MFVLSGGTAVTLVGTNMNSSAVPIITVTTVLETFNNVSDPNGRVNITSNSQVGLCYNYNSQCITCITE